MLPRYYLVAPVASVRARYLPEQVAVIADGHRLRVTTKSSGLVFISTAHFDVLRALLGGSADHLEPAVERKPRNALAVTLMRLRKPGRRQQTRSGAETESHAPSPGKSSRELVESSLQVGTCNGEESWGRCHRSPRTPAGRSRLLAPARCDSELPMHKRRRQKSTRRRGRAPRARDRPLALSTGRYQRGPVR